MDNNPALNALRRNVSGKIESGEAEAITEQPRTMTLEELKDALATYGANPEERGLEVYVHTGNDELRRVIAIEIEASEWHDQRVTLEIDSH